MHCWIFWRTWLCYWKIIYLYYIGTLKKLLMLFELCFLFLERGIWFFVIWGEFTYVWKRLFEEMCFIREIHFVNMKLLTILRLFLFIGVFGLKINKIKIMSWVVMFSPLSDKSEEFFLKCIYYLVYLMINYLILFQLIQFVEY